MEPSPTTFLEVGKLCCEWAYLEAVTEETIWGILDADERLGPLITARLDLRGRWQLILGHAHKKHNEAEIKELREINKDLTPVIRDRNIIVHGVIHAAGDSYEPRLGPYDPVGLIGPFRFTMPPCWIVFRGSEAGKSFPISTKAVQIIRENIQKITSHVVTFNKRFKYFKGSRWDETVETEWPKPLE